MTLESVDCTEIRDALLAGTLPAGPGVEEHLRACEPCAELLANQGTLGRVLSSARASDAAPAELLTAVEGALRAETGPRAWLRSRRTPVRLLLAGVAAAVVIVVGTSGGDGAAAPAGAALVWLGAFGLGGLACLPTFLASLGRPGVAPAARLALVLAAIALPFGFALGSTPGAPAVEGSFAELAFGCFVYGAILALPFFGFLWALDRSSRPWPLILAGFASVAGLAANMALVFHCGNTEPAHLAAGHATIGVVLGALGALWASTRRAS
jgi:hypothetical protein